MAESRFFHVGADGRPRRLASLAELDAALAAGGYAWLDFLDPAREDLAPLTGRFGVHPLSVEDCLDEDQVPKMEGFPTNTFLLLNGYRWTGESLALDEVDFVLGERFLVSVSGHAGGDAAWARVDRAVEREAAAVSRGPDFLLHVLLDEVVDAKLAAIETLQDSIDRMEEELLHGPVAFEPERLMRMRRDLLALRKSLFHEREVLARICRRDSPHVSADAVYHFRDVYDHLAKYFELIEVSREMITSLMEIYLSMINNRMAQVANRTNATVRRLTLITTVFMPLTLLAGIGGMSEWTMMTGQPNWRLAYPAFLGAMVVIGLVSYTLLKRAERRVPQPAHGSAAKAERVSSRRGDPRSGGHG